MKLVFVVMGLLAATTAKPEASAYEPITENYHENYGIPEAARIQALEDASEFGQSRITGGALARLGQFPYMGGLVIAVPRGRSVCGSSLISNTRAVTAAHCWYDGRTRATRLTVVLGSITIFRGGTRVTTNRVVVHPNWNPRSGANDVAVIRFGSVQYTNNIKAIRLATGSNNYAGSWATAIGYGLRGANTNIESNQPLGYVTMQVITNGACRRTYGQSVVRGSVICTSGANGRSTCGGDSGGPLVADNLLIGISAFGAAVGCTHGYPAGFTRVTSYTSWISAQ